MISSDQTHTNNITKDSDLHEEYDHLSNYSAYWIGTLLFRHPVRILYK